LSLSIAAASLEPPSFGVLLSISSLLEAGFGVSGLELEHPIVQRTETQHASEQARWRVERRAGIQSTVQRAYQRRAQREFVEIEMKETRH
jgi:hypothetical protein